jgi:hypothetical protein
MSGLHDRAKGESIITLGGHLRLAWLGLTKISGTAETAIYNGGSL